MKKRILYYTVFFIFWVLFFWIARFIFLIYNYHLSFSLSFGEWFSAFLYGTRMDASMSGYITGISAVLLVATSFLSGKTTDRTMSIFTLITLFISVLLVVSDMELYRHWGFRLDSTPLSYLKTPREAFGSASIRALIVQIAVFALLIWGAWQAYRKILRTILKTSKPAGWLGIPAFVFAGALMILPIRGSLGVAPMNVGFVYFHPNNIFANHAAINVVWNAGKSLLNFTKLTVYQFMDDEKAEYLFASLYPPTEKTDILLKNKSPNVIIIILESFTNRLIAPLGGLPDVTPNLNRLCSEGVVFSNIYSNSNRTDKGVLGVLNGYPSHPVAKVINFTEKTRRLPYINQDFKQAGYQTGFVFGYDILYSNFGSYLGNAGYDKFFSREDFPLDTYKGESWGVPDHLVLEKLLAECNYARPPFFKVFVGLSSHEPFEVPMPTVIKGNDAESLYLNSVYYVDKALGEFIESARQSDWWENTLIVVTSDHGTRHPDNMPNYHPKIFHIPMLWLGGAVAKTDTVVATVASQTDIAYTILNQLGMPNNHYRFSKDILGTPTVDFAFYNFNDGFGFVYGNAQIAFDNVSETVIYNEGEPAEEATEKGKAYLQIFSNDFNTRDKITETLNPKPETSTLKDEASNFKLQTSNLKFENLSHINDIDCTIHVALKYATKDNFTGDVLYEGFDGAYLQPDVALMLAEAQRYLQTLSPDGLSLLVYDAVRPLSVQRIMWERVKNTQYSRYVASPDRLSLHNFGAAVDLTIADSKGQPLDMGTPFDHFGRAAGISNEHGLIEEGILTRQQVQNRQLLRQVMHQAGFRSISGEWWHFNACTLMEAKQRYDVVE